MNKKKKFSEETNKEAKEKLNSYKRTIDDFMQQVNNLQYKIEHLKEMNKLQEKLIKIQEELLAKYRQSKCPMDPTKIKEYNLGRLVILSVKHSEFIKKG